MAALGPCGGLTASTFILLNEVSTVASAFALAGYMTDSTHVSSSGTSLAITGLANAFATVANLEDLATGLARATTPEVPGYAAASGLSANGTVPQPTLNTLANILAACVNTDGSGLPCTTLLSTARADGTTTGVAPSETATAALNIAHHPGLNVSTLYNVSASTPPFQPSLATTPNDFTLSLSFTAPSIQSADLMAVDAAGGLWVPSSAPANVTLLANAGTVLSGTTGFTGGGLNSPAMPAIDASGSVWIPDLNNNTLSRFTASGSVHSGAPYTSAVSGQYAAAFASNGNLWTNQQQGSVVQKTSSAGAPLFGNGYGLPETSNFGSVAADTSGGMYITAGNTVYHFNSSSNLSSSSGGGLSSATGVAIDHAGKVWAASYSTGTLSKFTSSGTAISPSSGYSGGGLRYPFSIAIDGSGRVWALNSQTNGLSVFDSNGNPLSPSSGYVTAYHNSGNGLQMVIDGSGNIWLPAGPRIVEYIGVATPVATPILAGNRGVLP